VIGRDAKDVSEESALDYVAAYTCGNDISSRKLQRDAAYAGRIPQWGFSKGFDTFAPLGPCLVSSKLIGDPAKLHLKTIVDGEVRQDEGVSDLLFNCAYLISYLSTGTTLQKGSIIMTGTPGGKPHPDHQFLKIANFRRCRRWDEPTKVSSSRNYYGSTNLENWDFEEWCQV
jgi:2-keto-4-pentenoate hydratase/2-oxohepta-3-ene-1,7-dioic acid hydratase in catechol pathway